MIPLHSFFHALLGMIFIGMIGFHPMCVGSGRPFWTEKSSWVEADRIYVVGVSTKNKTLEEAREFALKHAEKELLSLLHVESLQGVMFQTQMTHQDQSADGSWSVFRLMWAPVDVVRQLDSQGVKRSTHLRCVGSYTGDWVGTIGDRVLFKEDCRFVYIGNGGCTSMGTYPPLSESGSMTVLIETVMGRGCLPKGKLTCNYIFTSDRLAYDCGYGQFVYGRLMEVAPAPPPPTQIIVQRPDPALEILRFLLIGR